MSNQIEVNPSLNTTEVLNTNLLKHEEGSSFIAFLILSSSVLSLIISIVNHLNILTLPIRNRITEYTNKEREQILIVENTLREYLVIAGCQRVVIGLFHNGTSVGAIHFKKMTISHECTTNETISIKSKFDNVSLAKLDQELNKSSSYSFTKFDIKDDSLPVGCKSYMSENGIQRVLTRLLTNRKGIYGILELHYTETPAFDVINNKELLLQLESVHRKVCTLLDYVIKNKKIPVKKYSN